MFHILLSHSGCLWQRGDLLFLQARKVLPRDKDELLTVYKLLHSSFLEPLVPRLQSELCHFLPVLTGASASLLRLYWTWLCPSSVFHIMSTVWHRGLKHVFAVCVLREMSNHCYRCSCKFKSTWINRAHCSGVCLHIVWWKSTRENPVEVEICHNNHCTVVL